MEWSLSLISSWRWTGVESSFDVSAVPDELWFKILTMVVGSDPDHSLLWIYYVRVSKRWLKLITDRLTAIHIDGPAYARVIFPFKKPRTRYSSYIYRPTIRELGNIESMTTDFLLSKFRYLQHISLWNAANVRIRLALLNMPNLTSLTLSSVHDDLVPCMSELHQLRELHLYHATREPEFLTALTNLTRLAYRIPSKRKQDHAQNMSWIGAVVDSFPNLESLEAEECFCLDQGLQAVDLDFSCRPPKLSHLTLKYESIVHNPSSLTVRFNPTQLRSLEINKMGISHFNANLNLPQLREHTPLALEQLDLNFASRLAVNFASLPNLKSLSVPLTKIDPAVGQKDLSSATTLQDIEALDLYNGPDPSFFSHLQEFAFRVLPQYRSLRALHLQPRMARIDDNDHDGIVGLLASSGLPIQTLRFPCRTYQDLECSPVDIRNWTCLLGMEQLEFLETTERVLWCRCTVGPLVKHNALFSEAYRPHEGFCLFQYLEIMAKQSLKTIQVATVDEQNRTGFVIYESNLTWPGYDDRYIDSAVRQMDIEDDSTEPVMRTPKPHIRKSAYDRIQGELGIELIAV